MAEVADRPAAADAGGLHVHAARTFADLAEVRAFRQHTYLQRSQLVVDDELALDRRSIVLGLRDGTDLVGCVRVVPLPDPETGIAAFGDPHLAGRPAATEVGRLAVATGRSPATLVALLGLGSQWVVDHTPHRDYVAYCSPKLVAAYDAVGAVDLGLALVHPATGREYRAVAGGFDEAAERGLGLLAAMGGRPTLLSA